MRRLTYSVTETAQMLGISKTAVKRLLRRSAIPSVKISGRRLIPATALDAYVRQMMTQEDAPRAQSD